jgi:hypothetical protein
MDNNEYIRKQIQEHIAYEQTIQKANVAYCVEYYHPKTGKRITWSEKCSLINRDLHKRVKRIEHRFNCV